MSVPGGVTNYNKFDKKAELHGFIRDKMSHYILKFSAANSEGAGIHRRLH